jgi:hypothetical protein
MSGEVVSSLGSASNKSNAHDSNDGVRPRVTEPILFKFGPSRHGAASRSGNSHSEMKEK